MSSKKVAQPSAASPPCSRATYQPAQPAHTSPLTRGTPACGAGCGRPCPRRPPASQTPARDTRRKPQTRPAEAKTTQGVATASAPRRSSTIQYVDALDPFESKGLKPFFSIYRFKGWVTRCFQARRYWPAFLTNTRWRDRLEALEVSCPPFRFIGSRVGSPLTRCFQALWVNWNSTAVLQVLSAPPRVRGPASSRKPAPRRRSFQRTSPVFPLRRRG
jgi:hypothetical protein